MIDLRKEFRLILDEYGHYVLLARTNRNAHCSNCWNSTTREPDSSCPACGGTGYAYRLERHKTRQDMKAPIADQRRGALQQLPVGLSESELNVFYFMHNVRPVAGDYILLVGWDAGKPVNLYDVYEILDPQVRRGDGGRVEFYTVTACSRPAEIDKFAKVLTKSDGAV